ncbi:MAG: YjdF family protein [Clostridia bacterium]|nr:YjdF family protein [Clostridia bacterium]
MDEYSSRLTVFYEEPFWVGVFERMEGDRLSVSKVTFGAEPKGYEVLDYVRRHYGELRFSEPVPREAREKADSPKRRQRAAAKEMQPTGVGTKSQQALQAQRELMKVERKRITRAEREAEEQRRFELKQQQKKERKRGH